MLVNIHFVITVLYGRAVSYDHIRIRVTRRGDRGRGWTTAAGAVSSLIHENIPCFCLKQK